MFKSERANRVTSIVGYWILVIIIFNNSQDFKEDLNLLISIAAVSIAILYTAYQLLEIFKGKRD